MAISINAAIEEGWAQAEETWRDGRLWIRRGEKGSDGGEMDGGHMESEHLSKKIIHTSVRG